MIDYDKILKEVVDFINNDMDEDDLLDLYLYIWPDLVLCTECQTYKGEYDDFGSDAWEYDNNQRKVGTCLECEKAKGIQQPNSEII